MSIIQVKDLSFAYNKNEKQVLNDVSLTLEEGEVMTILGPNGAGKSTTIKMMSGILTPTKGRVLIDGRDIRTIPHNELRKKFGVVFQNDFLAEGTIADNIRFFRDLDDAALERAAEDAQAGFIAQKEGGIARHQHGHAKDQSQPGTARRTANDGPQHNGNQYGTDRKGPESDKASC